MTATTGVVAPSEAMFNVMMKELPSCVREPILERMKEYGVALLDAAGEKFGFDAEEASSSLISNNESKDKAIELSIKMSEIQSVNVFSVDEEGTLITSLVSGFTFSSYKNKDLYRL